MSIENDEQLFASLCGLFNLRNVYEILNVDDDRIRRTCTVPEFATLVINLKTQILEERAYRMTTKIVHVGR